MLRSIETEVGHEKGPLPEPEPFTLAPKIRKVPVIELFTGRYLRRTLVLTVVWVTQTVAEARATGTSVPYGIGRLSNIAGPIIISTLFAGCGYLSVFLFIAGTWLVGSLTLGIFGSSTRKRSMDIFDEVGPSAGGADLLKAA